MQLRAARVEAREVAALELRPLERHVAGVDEDGVLERRVDVEGEFGARLEAQLCAEQRRVRRHGRAIDAGQLTEEDERDAGEATVVTGEVDVVWGVVLERACRLAVGVRQRNPQLDAVQCVGLRRRDLRVGDAVTARHEVHLAGAHHAVHAAGVAVLDLAVEQPRDRLQAGVRVRRHVHAVAFEVAHGLGAVVVDEAPRADEGAILVRKGAAHLERSHAAEGNLTGLEYLDGDVVHVNLRFSSRCVVLADGAAGTFGATTRGAYPFPHPARGASRTRACI